MTITCIMPGCNTTAGCKCADDWKLVGMRTYVPTYTTGDTTGQPIVDAGSSCKPTHRNRLEAINSAVRKLSIIKRDFDMRGANATTMERAIDLLRQIARETMTARGLVEKEPSHDHH